MLKQEANKVYRRFDKELLLVEPWGENSFRVRATQNASFLDDTNSALTEKTPDIMPQIEIKDNFAIIKNGNITCEINPYGKLTFTNQNGDILLEEFDRNRERQHIQNQFNSALEINPRTFEPFSGTNNYKITYRFESAINEKLYGMGQYQQPYLDVKGCCLELAHRNSQASIPFVISNLGYGMLWNSPAIGQVNFAKNVTEWISYSSKQIDYWITAGDSPAQIEEAYANVTGKVPMMPEYGTGFWQCKLRYQSQEQIMEVARGYKERNIPVSVIVIDFFHWPFQGDWKLDLEYWPEPQKMVNELKEMGMELMVSIWPTVEEGSENYKELLELGFLTRSEHGKRLGQLGNACFIDPTNPDARKYVWNKIKQNYYNFGIKIFWLDEAEPEYTDYEFSHYRYFAGSDLEVGNTYPKYYAQMAYEGMESEGQKNIVNLLRCAWAGSQKYGALVWSGDIDSSFRSLKNQLAAGLNMGLSGIPWWTTDIGGFHGGNINDPEFHECLIRWFEFGVFCPVMRLHGFREPFLPPIGATGGGKFISGAANEIWSYTDDVFEICKEQIQLRERLRPYVTKLMEEAHLKGTPLMRPLFYDFPKDDKAWDIIDEYMFGPNILVAPILDANVRNREVYLPCGKWQNLHTEEVFDGDTTINCDAPIHQIPVFIRDGAKVF